MNNFKKKNFKYIKYSVKKLLYHFGWTIKKIYVQKEPNKKSPSSKEMESLSVCSGVFNLGAPCGG